MTKKTKAAPPPIQQHPFGKPQKIYTFTLYRNWKETQRIIQTDYILAF